MKTTYDPSLTMLQARKLYFEVNQFGEKGGYEDAWVNFKLGPIPFPFPNTAGRIRAVKFHDLHHILTGYDTDLRGEFEISAWEIGAGCKDFYAAWVLNLGGIVGGLMIAPRRTVRAFARGLASSSLYGRDLDDLLQLPVGETRARFIGSGDPPMTAKSWLLFAVSALAGLVIGTLEVIFGTLLLPVGLVSNFLLKRSTAAAVKPA